MKITTLSVLLFFSIGKICAQNYQITFAGTGAATNVDSVKVENLSQCTSLAFSGTDILSLSVTVGTEEHGNPYGNHVTLYPNPSSGNCSLEFEASSENKVCITLYDMSGKVVLLHKEFLPEGLHTFHLNGITSGIYSLKVESDHYLYASKLISVAGSQGSPSIKNTATLSVSDKQTYSAVKKEMKETGGGKSIIGMQFNAGDTLKLTGKSGNCRTVKMLIPNQSQAVIFNFVKCTDADSNHYAVIQIGSQVWMQENLKTTKYRDGSGITNEPDSANWAGLTTGAYCDYHNLTAEGAYYGHLYNYYTVADSRNMCPIGWHVPSHAEWNIMEKFLDNSVDTTALGGTGTIIGRILKEGCNTRWQYWDSTSGRNSSGFTALCSNYRVSSGAWSLAPDNNHDCGFWTSTSYNTNSAWYRSLRWCTCDIYVLFPFKKSGNSVRCIRDY